MSGDEKPTKMLRQRRRRQREKAEREGPRSKMVESPDTFDITQEGDQTALTVRISDLTPPKMKYSADVGDVYREGDEVHFLFGQTRPVTNSLYTLACITYPVPKFEIALQRTKGLFETLTELIERLNKESRKYTIEPDQIDSVSDQNLHRQRVTYERIAYQDEEAELEFYYMSPSGFQQLKREEDPSRLLRPAIAVSVSSVSLLGLLEKAYNLEGFEDV